MKNLRINGDRLWNSLMEMARIGATDRGGVHRLALTDEDKAARDLFVDWCIAAGCTVTVDRMGNIFARRGGTDDSLPPIMSGSHLDSQPFGGKFDGAYGVLAALEVIRTLNDFGYETPAPIEAAVWTNEEGSRFPPAMVSSGVFVGAFDLEYGLSRADTDGRTIGEELARIGYAGDEEVGGRPVGAFFEVHIEQGPILEAEDNTIGVVTDAHGQRWYEITVTGQEAHAGPTPMRSRRDALVAASRLVEEVNRIGLAYEPDACATVGMIEAWPNSRNVIPGRAFLTVDFRHPNDDVLTEMDAALRGFCASIRSDSGMMVDLQQIWHSPPIRFDDTCVAAVRAGAEFHGYSYREIVSGAGHDACYMSRIAPTSMVFVPCKGGISHAEIECATPEDLAAGCQVLLEAIVVRANAPVATSEQPADDANRRTGDLRKGDI